jgi:hypothetical protein
MNTDNSHAESNETSHAAEQISDENLDTVNGGANLSAAADFLSSLPAKKTIDTSDPDAQGAPNFIRVPHIRRR